MNDATKVTFGEPNGGEFYREVGARIRAAREQKEMSQGKLASGLNLSRTSMTNIERGKQKFLLHTFIGIAKLLDVPITSLLPDLEKEPAKLLIKLPPNLDKPERDFVKRALQPIIHHESKSQNNHIPDGREAAGQFRNRRTAGRR